MSWVAGVLQYALVTPHVGEAHFIDGDPHAWEFTQVLFLQPAPPATS